MDWPAAAYWRELAEHYPDAKVILTVRDPDRWYDSVSETIFGSALAERRPLPLRRRVIRWLVARRAPDFALYPRMARATFIDRVFDGRIDDREHVIEVFERHIAEVKATIPPDRLLVFDVRQGWAPLCEFLGYPPAFPETQRRFAWTQRRRDARPRCAAGDADHRRRAVWRPGPGHSGAGASGSRRRRGHRGDHRGGTAQGLGGAMTNTEYLVIGAGPAGLQLGYFLEQAGRDYLILEAGPAPAPSSARSRATGS